MKMAFIILAVVVLIGLLGFFFFKYKSETKNSDTTSIQNSRDTIRLDKTPPAETVYEGLKKMAYSTQYNQLNLPDAKDKKILYGVLMDWDYDGKAVITLVSFKTGDLSLYISTGGMILGAGEYSDANIASKEFVEKAAILLPQATNADTSLALEKGMLKFYLLTTKGKYTVKDKMENIHNHTSPLSTMFAEADKLITIIRTTQEKMQQQQNNKK